MHPSTPNFAIFVGNGIIGTRPGHGRNFPFFKLPCICIEHSNFPNVKLRKPIAALAVKFSAPRAGVWSRSRKNSDLARFRIYLSNGAFSHAREIGIAIWTYVHPIELDWIKVSINV